MRTRVRRKLVEVKAMNRFHSTAKPYNDGWLVTTNLPDFGEIHAFAETESEIEIMARQNICSFTDLQESDIQVEWEFEKD